MASIYEERTEIHVHMQEGPVETEAETGVMPPQAKEPGMTRNRKGQGRVLPERPWREQGTAHALISDVGLQHDEGTNSSCFQPTRLVGLCFGSHRKPTQGVKTETRM